MNNNDTWDDIYCSCCGSCGETGCCPHYCDCCNFSDWEEPDPESYKVKCKRKEEL